ncbi:MAG: hypothetical protein HGA96_11295 [Desulfobulbaceae bacterium]|nr:hypothetical protein [Desulfobulbaceae bacterium]
MKINQSTLLVYFLVLLFVNSIGTSTSAYDNKTVHRKINENACLPTNSKVNEYIVNNLGFTGGINTLFDKKRVQEWLSEGGYQEDFLARPLLHFHDPLQPWSNAGLWGTTSASVTWAQSNNNGYSWQEARGHYYQALTTRSETEFATTFRSLGQLMHLVSDMAVPAHVRDDAHLFGDLYEAWTADIKNDKPYNYAGIKVDSSIFNRAVTTPGAPAPITALWDQEEPGITITTGSNDAGLAEYTNANFFSEDTVFQYPNPSKETAFTKSKVSIGGMTFADLTLADLEMVIAEDQTPDLRLYAYATDKYGDYKLASLGYFSADAPEGPTSRWNDHVLDDAVSSDYATRLIPAAVGYSAALLDYFFRGKIAVTIPPGGVKVKSFASTGFDSITLEAKNISELDDGLTAGTLDLVAKYRPADEDQYPNYSEFRYIRAPYLSGQAPTTTDIPRGSIGERFTFDLSGTPLPFNAKRWFRGRDIYLSVGSGDVISIYEYNYG